MSRGSKELFLEACGLSGPLPLDLEGRVGHESLTFDPPFVVAGRGPGTDLVLDDPSVSRRHAYLQAIAGRVFCVDLGSRTGVAWEQGEERSGWVDGRRGVLIGPYRIKAGAGLGPADLEDPLAAHSLEDAPLPELILEFPEMPERPPPRVSRVLTLLGRAPECRLRWTDPAVSKFHCSLLRTPAGVWVVDLFGRVGIEVNGSRVRWAQLEHGDLLRVGPDLIRIQIRSQSPSRDRSVPRADAAGELMVAAPPPGWPATRPEAGNDPTRSPLMPSPGWLTPPGIVAGLSGDPAPLKAELMEPFLAHLANQFDQMQQQMFDRFGQMQHQMFDQMQQAMMMMAQMFGTLHRDQMTLVRDELAQLRQLNQDLHALQAELATRAPAATPPAVPASDTTSIPESLARIEAVLLASEPRPSITPAESRPVGPATAGQGLKGASSSPPPGAGEHGTIKNGAIAAQGLSPENRRAGPTPAPTRDPHAADAGGQSREDIHTLLHLRIAAIQKERQGRWQRILNLMLGQ